MLDTIERIPTLAQRLRESYGTDQMPGFLQITNDQYLGDLMRRIERVAQWSMDQRPALVSVAEVHARGSDRSAMRYLEDWIFACVTTECSVPCVVGLEFYGDDQPLTPAAWKKIFRKGAHAFGNPMTAKAVDLQMQQSNDAVLRIMARFKHVQVICAEEQAPCLFHGHLLNAMKRRGLDGGRLRRGHKDDPDMLACDLAMLLAEMRSYIMTVRLLERLRVSGRSKGVLIQGYNHATDTKNLKEEFGYEYSEHRMRAPPATLRVQ